MSSAKRLSRWQRARDDWQGVQGKRELVVACIGAIVSAAVLLVAGFAHDAAVVGITVLGSAIALALIVPAADFYWCWLQAPIRLLTEEVVAIRGRLDRVEQGLAPAAKAGLGVRHTLMNHKRVGDELVAEAAKYGLAPSDGSAQVWTNAVIDFLGAQLPAGLDQFMTAGAGSSSDRIEDRLQALEQMLEQLHQHRTSDTDAQTTVAQDGDRATVPLPALLQQLLRRGEDCRVRARISDDGSSTLIELWEEAVLDLLRASERDDLALRFRRREPSDRLRGIWSGAFETRKRVDRELGLIADFVRELQGAQEDGQLTH